MALPSSGALALSDFNTELGNSAGTQINLDASAVRALIGKSSGAVASFSDYYGASAVSNWSSTMTVGQSTFLKQTTRGYGTGFISFGSLTDDTCDNLSGATVTNLSFTGSNINLSFQSQALNNSGFTTLNIGSLSLNRTAANYSSNANGTSWSWTGQSDPFPSTGSTISISMT